MRTAVRNIILNAPVKPVFELGLKTSRVPEKAIAGTSTFTRSSTATCMGYPEAANGGDNLAPLTIPEGVGLFPGARFLASNNTWSGYFADGAAIPEATLKGGSFGGSRTNSFLQSNSFLTAPNGQGGGVATYNAGDDSWTLTSVAALKYTLQDVTLTAGNVVTISRYFKKTTGAQDYYPVLDIENGSTIAPVTIDTTSGVVTSWIAYTNFTIIPNSATCVDNLDGYWRVSITFTVATTSIHTIMMYNCAATTANQNSGQYYGSGTGSTTFKNVQVELGSFASSYIPTTTAAVSCAADVLSYPTAGNLNAESGVIYLEFTPEHAPSGTIALWGSYTDSSNFTQILHDSTSYIFRKSIAGTNYDAAITKAFATGVVDKLVIAWGSSGMNIAVNDVLGTPNGNSSTLQLASTFQLGSDGAGGQQCFGEVKNIKFYPKQLKASKLLSLTS